jgi:cation:H+ antiporter
MWSWLIFILSAGAIVVAGIRLARAGDTLATLTGLGGMWMGAILVAAATSLPELTTDVSAVLQGAPALAVGDLFGSNMANMLILAVADLLTRPERMLARVAVNQLAVGTLALLLATFAILGLVLQPAAIVGASWITWAIAATYVSGMRFLHRNRAEPPFQPADEVAASYPRRAKVRQAAVAFATSALVILIAAPFLADSAAAIADSLGISRGFAGMLLLALTTSIPEAAVTLASVRLRSYDLAVGNLFGSNCFNMAALLVLDLADGRVSLFANLHGSLAVGALAGMLLTSMAMLGVLDRSQHTRRRIELPPLLMIAAYAIGLALAYGAER